MWRPSSHRLLSHTEGSKKGLEQEVIEMILYFLGLVTGAFLMFLVLMMFALMVASKDDERSEGGDTNGNEDYRK